MQVMLRLLMRHLDLGQPFYHSAGEIIAMSSLPYNIDEDHVGADSPTTDLTWTDETNRVTVITGVGNDRLQVSKGNPRASNDKTTEIRLTALKVPRSSPTPTTCPCPCSSPKTTPDSSHNTPEAGHRPPQRRRGKVSVVHHLMIRTVEAERGEEGRRGRSR